MSSASASESHAEVVSARDVALVQRGIGVSKGVDGDCVSEQLVPANTKRQPPSVVGQFCVGVSIVVVMIGVVLWRLIRRMPFILLDAQSPLIVKKGRQIRVVVLICFDT